MKGRIADADIEQLRARADIVEIASQYMKIKRVGRTVKALCPFHSEKTPSFSIEPTKGVYYCFGCGKSGDVITLVRELEQMDFVEAVELLARKTGITLHYEQLSAQERQHFKIRSRLIDAHAEAVDFYHAHLMKGDEASTAREYLRQRKLHQKTVEHFKVGWSPSAWDSLTKHLRDKGFTPDELIAAGLSLRNERGALFDRFRGRVMFPIFDVTGEPRAFGARRLLQNDDGPKYLNSAESPIYKKGSLLYALNWAKPEIVRSDVAIIVEGYTDVIALHQEGIPLAVATCGTALGIEHFQALSRFSTHVILALDGDEAGLSAAERAVEKASIEAQGRNMELRVLTVPQGSDPAEFVTARGAEEFRSLLQQTVPVVEFRLSSKLKGIDVSEPENRARGLRACLGVLAQVQDEIVRNEYTKWVADRCKLDYDSVFIALGKTVRGGRAPSPAGIRKASSQASMEREAIKLAVQYPQLVSEYIERLAPEDFSSKANRTAWEHVRAGKTDPASAPEDGTRDLLTRLSVEPIEGALDSAPSDRLIEEIFMRLEEFALTRQISDKKSKLEKINPVEQPEAHSTLFKELVELEAARRRLVLVDEPAGA
ncbi:MAG: DNA primase [Actinomycetota bacterium]